MVAVLTLFLAECSESDSDDSASQAQETTAAGNLTTPGTTLKLGETATVMTEDSLGNLLTWELTVNEPVEESVEEVHDEVERS